MTIPEYLLSIGWHESKGALPGPLYFCDRDENLLVDVSGDCGPEWSLSIFDDDGRGRWLSKDEGDTLEELRTALGNLKVRI